MSSSNSAIFSGSSRYATDFTQVINRAVAIASLPLQQMQADKQSMSDESSALSSLNSRFSSIQTAINSLASATTGKTFSASASDSSVLSTTLSGTPLTGSYAVKVTSLGSYASGTSTAGYSTVSDPAATSLSPASSFTLTTDSGTFTITPNANTLNALADAINATAGANLRATIINVGPSSAPDYRLSLQSTKLGTTTMTLADSLLDTPEDTQVTSKAGLNTVTDPSKSDITPNGASTLTVAGESKSFTGVASLNDLVQKINDAALGGVTAAAVNVGTADAPDYRLQLTKPSGTSVDLTENLISSFTAGTKAKYSINGSADIQSDSRTITVAPGLTADLKSDGGGSGLTSVITVSRDTSGVSSALSSFVRAYNDAANEIAQHHSATQKSALEGNSILLTARESLRGMVTYSAGGYFSSLVVGKIPVDSTADLGLSIDNSGQLTFDSSRFAANTANHMDDLLSVLGSTTSGGFLKAASDSLNMMENSASGALPTAMNAIQDRMKKQDDAISAKQEQINQLQTNLQDRMSKADAAIAILEQQVNYFTGMFDTMMANAKTGS